MCGICGIYNVKTERPVVEAQLVKMRDSLTHRGPDEAGIYRCQEVGLAMRRLSIIDLQTGSQPIWNEDRTIGVVYNGEIYNYKELRRALEQKGHHFSTNSDTEVLVHAYEQFGQECVSLFEGMFAFALWDQQNRRLLLARDRFGIKPLFYAETTDGFVFGSEIKSILALGYPRQLDFVALDQYLSHFYVPAPLTIYAGIRKLPPGHALLCDKGQLHEFEYWDLAYNPEPYDGQEEAYCAELYELLKGAIKRHLQSDVPLGAFLSGGLDSSTVVALMSALVSEPVRTFTVGFQQASYDERPMAKLVADRFKTTHVERVFQPDWNDLILRLVGCFDEPFGDYSAIPTFMVSQLARESVKVVLSGDGGDELFAGYQTHYAFRIANLYRRVPMVVRRNLIRPIVEKLPTSMNRISLDYMAKRFITGCEMPFEQGHYTWKVIFSEHEKGVLFTPEIKAARQHENDGFSIFEAYFRKVSHLDPLSQLLYVDAKTFLVDDNLAKVDRTSMANSIEVRVPFLDTQLVNFLLKVPTKIKQPRWQTKHFLRQTMNNKLPASILHGKKKGFTPPMPYWLQCELKPILLDALSPSTLAKIGLFNQPYVQSLVDDHLQGRRDNNRQLWALMFFSLWWQIYQPT